MKSWGKNSFKLKMVPYNHIDYPGRLPGIPLSAAFGASLYSCIFFRLDHPSRHRTVVPESEAPQNYRGNLRAAPSGSRIWDGLLHACQYPD